MNESPKKYDAIVVGSGPGAVFAAYSLRPLKILVLDTGLQRPPSVFSEKHLHQEIREGLDQNSIVYDSLIGNFLEGVSNLNGQYISPKLKAPGMRYVWNSPALAPGVMPAGFDPTISYSIGGLANAWGAGVMQFLDQDLKDFPIKALELEPYYKIIADHIGISGTNDDLSKFFESSDNLQPPIPLSPIANNFLTRYEKRREYFNKRNFYAGRLRLAVLTRPHMGREPYKALLHDFFETSEHAIYSPRFTLQELIKNGDIDYIPSKLITHFEESSKGVSVFAKDLETGSLHCYSCSKLFLGAGAINSARIVLASHNDYKTKLPLLENPVCFIPFIDLSLIGKKFPTSVFPGGELAVIFDHASVRAQASLYGLYGPMRSDLIQELPLALGSNIKAVKYLGPAMGMLQVFMPAGKNPDTYIQLQNDLSLSIVHSDYQKAPQVKSKTEIKNGLPSKLSETIKPFLNFLHKMKYFASSSLCKTPPPGSSIHYAGTLGMSDNPINSYQTNASGLLNGTQSIYIVDAGNFPSLPAKNHTFTIMANSMRIAEIAKESTN
ncbi:MAG TPA: hypothetical protein PKA63_09270 [Oligoflexia bacterium]|nr:hypothetical protein [Oligoflexia bacterium]HMP48843.1 hypothetical protein [Oligoflexia bacterium]